MKNSPESRSPGFGHWEDNDDKHSIELPEKRRKLSAEGLSETSRKKDKIEDDILDKIDRERAGVVDEDATPIGDLSADEIEFISHTPPDDSDIDDPMAHEVMDQDGKTGEVSPASLEVDNQRIVNHENQPAREALHKKALIEDPEHAFIHRKPKTDFWKVKKQQEDKRDKKQAA